MKFTASREGTIALSYPLIYWYAALQTIVESISILKTLFNHNDLESLAKTTPNNTQTTHKVSTTATLHIIVAFLVIAFVLNVAINAYLVLAHSRRWVIGWFIFFFLGAVIDLVELTFHFTIYSMLFSVVTASLAGIILWQLFFQKQKLEILKNKVEVADVPKIHYQPEKHLQSPSLIISQKSKVRKSVSKTKSKPKKK